ncbi:MAG: septum formation initiator family protein [Minisyncoccia bacterium]|jgi:outer membrane lipoprotein-sorting protein
MRIVGAVILFVVLVSAGARVYAFFAQEKQLSADLADIQTRLTKAQYDEASLQSEAQYLANPLNLEKELRARFNYKKPGETMIIIVPAQSSTATTTGG